MKSGTVPGYQKSWLSNDPVILKKTIPDGKSRDFCVLFNCVNSGNTGDREGPPACNPCHGRNKMAKGKDKGNVNEKKKPAMTIKEKRKAKKEKHTHE